MVITKLRVESGLGVMLRLHEERSAGLQQLKSAADAAERARPREADARDPQLCGMSAEERGQGLGVHLGALEDRGHADALSRFRGADGD